MKWISAIWQAFRGLFPFTKDGRATLVYLAFAGSVPALTLAGMLVLHEIRWFDANADKRLEAYSSAAMWIFYGQFLGQITYAAFVSIRALDIDWKNGKASMNSREDNSPPLQDGDTVELNKIKGEGTGA